MRRRLPADVRTAVTQDRLDHFTRFVAIDWSGARGAVQPGIAVAECVTGDAAPRLVAPPAARWSRAAILAWLLDLARMRAPALIGLDFSPAFPFADEGAYFPGWSRGPTDMISLWRLVEATCADDPHLSAASFVAHAEAGRHFLGHPHRGDRYAGGHGRMRRCETLQRSMALTPSSCFKLVGAAQVGKSSLTGMRMLARLRGAVPFWPLDAVPADGPLLVEIYTSLAARAAGLPAGRAKMRSTDALNERLTKTTIGSLPYPEAGRLNDHETDALLTAAWLRRASLDLACWRPARLTTDLARTEGWTFGVT